MAVVFESASSTSTGASAVSSLTIAGVTLTGSNRCLVIGVGSTVNAARSWSIARGSDTFTELAARVNETASNRVYGELWISTNEPAAAATDLVVTDGTGSNDYWGVSYINATGVDQTTRNDTPQLNPDERGSAGGIDALAVTSETGDLVVDFITARQVSDVFVSAGDGTLRTNWSTGTTSTDSDGAMCTAAGAASVSLDYSASAVIDIMVHWGMNLNAVSNPAPTVSYPGTIKTAYLYNEAIGTLVTIGDTNDNLSTIRYQGTSGKVRFNYTASGTSSISAGANNSNDLTITASNQTDLLAAHALTTMTCLMENSTDTVTITATDALSASDAQAFTVDGVYLDVLASSQTDLNAYLATLTAESAVAATYTLNVTGIDDQSLEGTGSGTVTVEPEAGSGESEPEEWLTRRRRR